LSDFGLLGALLRQTPLVVGARGEVIPMKVKSSFKAGDGLGGVVIGGNG
jgi:hypothetical protein